ncbi:MAG: hypothetical protein IPQ08_06210 [Chitinophagaceae bacterium]|nr:hypothetical protein [Chitinophagaceae bacterium]
MADLFELCEPDIEIKIKGRAYKICDPSHKDKVLLYKEQDALTEKKDSMNAWDYNLACHDMNKKHIKLYLKQMTDEDLDQLGESSQLVLLEKLFELLPTKFGAVVKKDEKK